MLRGMVSLGGATPAGRPYQQQLGSYTLSDGSQHHIRIFLLFFSNFYNFYGFSYALLCFGLSKHGGWKRLKTSTIFSTISFDESRFFQSTKQFKNFSLLRERKSKSTEKYLLKSWKKKSYFSLIKKLQRLHLLLLKLI